MSECVGPAYRPGDYAGFVRRTAALAIDAVLLLAVGLSAPFLWYALAPAEWVTEVAYLRIEMAWIIAAIVYMLGFRLTTHGTPGYRIVRIRYAYMLSEKPTFLSLGFRALLALFLMWFFALDHIWILFDKRKQAWHDKVTGFYVVKKDAQPIGTQRIVRRLINFMMLTFVVWEPVEPGETTTSTR